MSRIEDDIKSLIFELTGHQNDDLSLKYCCAFMREIVCENTPTPPSSIASKLEAFSTKYDYHGFPEYAQQMSEAVQTFLQSDSNKGNEDWLTLDLMLQLSADAFKPETLSSLEHNLQVSRLAVFPEIITEEEKINWFKYLQEGSEKFKLPTDDEDSEDEFDMVSEHIEPASVETPVPTYNDLFKGFQCSENVVLDENTEVKRTLKEAVDAESSLRKCIQHSWWNGEESTIALSSHPSANFGQMWESVQRQELLIEQESPSNFLYHDEYKIIRELLWILIANDRRVSKRIELLRTQTSVPSLIQETFAAIVDDILNTAEKYRTLTSFCDEILGTYALRVSFTLQAYAFAIKDMLSSFLAKIIELENIVKRQDSTYTLLTLYDDLGEHLRMITFIFNVHKECGVENWMEEIPWICAVRILSVLLSKYQEISSKPWRQILLRIFFKTFKIYAEIIDVWLTEGKLNDWKNEFFIQKSPDGKYVAFPFPDGLFHGGTTVSPLFHHLSEKLLNCYQSIDFLCKLNKTRELKTEILKEGKLLEHFIDQLKQRTHSKNVQCSQTLEQSVPKQDLLPNFQPNYDYIGRISDVPYLVAAFGDQLCIYDETQVSVKHSLKDPDVNFEVTLAGPILEQVLCNLIKKRDAVIVKLFRTAIVDDYKFFQHIRNLKDLLLMDWSGFCSRLPIRLEKQIWIDHNSIRVQLYDCVESNKILIFNDLFRFTIEDDDDMGNFEVNISSIMRAIDRISIQYEVQWPLNMIFTPEILTTFYAPLLKLVLKLRFAFSAVSRLRFKDIPQIRLYAQKLRRVQMFRHWVVLLLQKLHSYLLLAISQSLSREAVENGVEIETFSTLLESYTSYVHKTKRYCLIQNDFFEQFGRALNRLWLVCDDVVHLWSEATKLQISEKHVSQSVELYLQCLWYLTRILQKFLHGELCPLFDLWSDLNRMLESHKTNIPEDLSFRSGHM